jgi:hypothetical protein
MLLLGFKGFLGFDLLSFQNNFRFAYKNMWILSHQQYQWFLKSLKLLGVTKAMIEEWGVWLTNDVIN